MSGGLRILVVHSEVPMRDFNSLSVRLHALLSLMVREGHEVTLLARSVRREQVRHAQELQSLGIEVVYGDPVRAAEAGWPASGDVLDLAALLSEGRWDVAWLSEVAIAEQYTPIIRSHAPLARVVADTGDVAWVREARGAEVSGDAAAQAVAQRTRAREAAAYGAADAVVAVSDADAAAVRELAPDVPVAVISNIHAPAPAGPPWEERSGLLFVGYYGHRPNVDAVVSFHAQTWPRIRAAIPECTLTLVGASPPPAITALAGEHVTVTGHVPAIRPYLDAARLSIAPLRFGAGVKGKVGEALAAGLPVVGTTIAFEGMDLEPGVHVSVADDPAGFAAAVVRLYADRDLWTRMSGASHVRIGSLLGPQAAAEGLRELMASLAGPMWIGTEAAISDYLRTHATTPGARLVVPVPVAPEAQGEAVERITSQIRSLGYDEERIPDIDLVPTDRPFPLPSRASRTPAGSPHRRRPRPAAAVVVLAPDDASLAARQLEAVAAAVAADSVEVLVAADALSPAAHAAAQATGARVIGSDRPLGRRGILQRAVSATAADAVIVLDALAHPDPGLAAPLIAALHGGAALASPRVNGVGGWATGSDGDLVPAAAANPPVALALDCLAARRQTWLDLPAEFPAKEGHFETQLGRWAHLRGQLAVAADARVNRLAGPPATVVICSHNRGHELESAVVAVLIDGLHGEIVLVDNASTDDTALIGAELARRHPGSVRLISEPRAGLSHARNAGLAAARHDLVVYLDDDARPAPGWLAHLTTGLARPGTAIAGGPICPLWPASRRPDWPPAGVERLFAVLDLGDRDRAIAPPDHVYGGNWAARRSALEAIGGFDPAFGVSPDTRLGGEEIAAAEAIHARGLGEMRWVPRAAVGHIVGEARMDERTVVIRSLLGGVERAVRAGTADPERLLARAREGAQALASACQLTGSLALEEAADRLTSWPAGLLQQTLAADLLGEVAGCAAVAGVAELVAGPLTLRVRPEHARGLLRSSAMV